MAFFKSNKTNKTVTDEEQIVASIKEKLKGYKSSHQKANFEATHLQAEKLNMIGSI